MTDYPRFQSVTPQACDRDYHGARLVNLVFRLVDLWQERRKGIAQLGPQRPGSCLTNSPRLQGLFGIEGLMRRILPCLLVLICLGASLAVQAAAQESVRLRGSIEAVADHVYSIRSRDNQLVKVRLPPGVGVAASVKSTLSDIVPGSYIGVAAIPHADGTLRALEAHIFHETMRGTAEGHRAWDLLPKSTMTNAVVHEVVQAVDATTVILKYKNGEQRVLIPHGTTIVTYLPASVAELNVGAIVFIPSATTLADGTFEAPRVMVGRDVPPPQ